MHTLETLYHLHTFTDTREICFHLLVYFVSVCFVAIAGSWAAHVNLYKAPSASIVLPEQALWKFTNIRTADFTFYA
jgi:hypothetical protein